MTKISIITINYNNMVSIDKTLSSLAMQDFNDCEFIFVDGASSDGSLEKIKDFCSRNVMAKYISEVDHGIYDAMNKGLKLASGELIGFVNSGDALFFRNTLKNIWDNYIALGKPVAIYGNKFYRSQDGLISRVWRPGRFARWKYLTGWMTPHQATYIQRSCYNDLEYDTSFSIAADYKLMLQLFFVNKLTPQYIDEDIVVMEDGGLSNGTISGVIRSNIEVLRSWKNIYYFIPFWIFLFKPLSKIIQKSFTKKDVFK